jgi:two-component system cell cycle sensor histidine kinase/response regulator CckA
VANQRDLAARKRFEAQLLLAWDECGEKARVFEPFFPLKMLAQGTGLGLSTCYGIIKQSGGHISVYSELAWGTTFKFYLPQAERQTKIPIQRFGSPDLPRGTETILLVEDDPAL